MGTATAAAAWMPMSATSHSIRFSDIRSTRSPALTPSSISRAAIARADLRMSPQVSGRHSSSAHRRRMTWSARRSAWRMNTPMVVRSESSCTSTPRLWPDQFPILACIPLQVGVFLHVLDPERGRAVRVLELAAQAARAEELGFDSVWVMDHFFIEWQGRRVFAHDPMLQLAVMAAATSRIRLGPLVLGSPFREPAQLAREAATLQDLSGGRLILGLGCGWYEAEFEAAGIPFDHLVGRFQKSLQRLVPMLLQRRLTPEAPAPVW